MIGFELRVLGFEYSARNEPSLFTEKRAFGERKGKSARN